MQPELAAAPPFAKRSALVLVAATCLVAARAPAPPAPAAPALAGYHLVPLLGGPLEDAVDDADGDSYDPTGKGAHGSCLPFLAPYVAHPNWRLTIVERASSCTTDQILATYAVSADGDLWWREPDMPDRRLQLGPEELARLAALDAQSCVRTRWGGYGERYYLVSVAADAEGRGGAHIGFESPLGAALDAILDGAAARYVEARFAALGPIHVHLAIIDPPDAVRRSRLTIEIDGLRLRILHHGREVGLVGSYDLEPADLVELVDWAFSTNARAAPDDLIARGTLRAGGRTVPLGLTYGLPRALGAMRNYLQTAKYAIDVY